MMARSIPIGSSAALAALAMPTQNWGQLMVAKDQNLRYQSILTQQAEQNLLEERQASAEQQAYWAKLKSLPLELPDKRRVDRWLKGQEAETAKKLRDDYQGNLTQFMAAEGPSWMQSVLGNLESSDEYKTGLANLDAITQAKEAMRRGENIIGQVHTVDGTKHYVPATQQLQDYYLGKTPRFVFNGSYKDDDSLLKHFGSTYAPGKLPYEQTPVSEEEKLNYLLSSNRPDVAMDLYLSKYQHAQVFYKTKPLDEFIDFQHKQQDQAIQLENQGTKRQMDRLRFGNMQKQGILLDQKIAKNNGQGDGDGNDPAAYLRRVVPQSIPQPGVEYKTDGDSASRKVLPYSGYNLGNFVGKGGNKASFNAIDIFDKESTGALGALVGAEKVTPSKENPTGWRGGKIQEGILASNGFNAIDLAGTNHTITHIDPKIYTNPREFGPSGQPLSANGPMGFLRVTVKLADKADAKKAGLIEGLFSSDTKVGAGAYNSDTREVTLYTPIGNIYKNTALSRYLGVQDAGMKTANDFSNPFTLGVDPDDY